MNESVEKQMAPNGIASVVLGGLSLGIGWLWGLGIILGIIGLIFSKKGYAAYNENPDMYKASALLKVGKITSIVGIVFGVIMLIYWIVIFALAGTVAAFGDF